jgi:hypothetical protein
VLEKRASLTLDESGLSKEEKTPGQHQNAK